MAYEIAWAGVIFAVAAIPVLLLPSWVTWTVSSILALGSGLTTFMLALQRAGFAACPGCGARVWGLSLSRDNVGSQCGQCLRFIESAGGELTLTPEDRIAPASVFGVDVGVGEVDFPDVCAACGAPAARRSTLPRRRGRPGLEVPYCGAHERGARLEAHDHLDVLYARSLAFIRAVAARRGGALVGKDRRAGRARPGAALWEAGFGFGMIGLGFGLYLLLGWAEENEGYIGGRTSMMILYLLLGKKALGGLLASVGTLMLMHWVAAEGEALRRRLGLG